MYRNPLTLLSPSMVSVTISIVITYILVTLRTETLLDIIIHILTLSVISALTILGIWSYMIIPYLHKKSYIHSPDLIRGTWPWVTSGVLLITPYVNLIFMIFCIISPCIKTIYNRALRFRYQF